LRFAYDGMGRLKDLDHKTGGGATLLAGYDYTYDAASRITSIVSSVEGTSTFTYDVTNQLTAADHTSQPDENYSFDLNGNRTMAGHTVVANNRLSTDGTYNYTYDNEGNMLSRTKISDSTSEEYAWDHRNRLVKVTFKDEMGATTKTVEHAYDVYNRWIRRTVDADGPGPETATDTFFAYDGYHAVLQFDGPEANDIDHRYLFGPAVDQILADQDVNNLTGAGNTLWGLSDHLGTVRDVVDLNEGTGVTSVTNHRSYNSFGTQTAETNAAVDFLFGEAGKMLEEHTLMNNHRNRWLRGGWWVNEDLIGFGGGDTNLRRDVHNNAVNRVDPDGLEDYRWAAIKWWLYEAFIDGPVNVVKGGRDLVVETGLGIRDSVAVGADAAATAAGHPLGVEEISQAGQTAKPSDPDFGEKVRERYWDVAANCATFGVAGMQDALDEYDRTGDEDAFQRRMGGGATANLGAAGLGRLASGPVRGGAGAERPPVPAPRNVGPNPMTTVGRGFGQAAERGAEPGARTPLPRAGGEQPARPGTPAPGAGAQPEPTPPPETGGPTSTPAPTAPLTSAEIGAARAAKVAELTGGKVVSRPVRVKGLGSTDIDVLGPNGEFIGVGGPAKAINLSKLGRQLQILKRAAEENNTCAKAYFEEGTPVEVINLAKKWLGEDNVVVFPKSTQ
jgi:hypothetical protein